ncbi:NPCBM/NEW2 domain-containing protein [bacterium]|nr:NPCBM/NEW2 domain-containing protein [bacterium]
MLDRKRAGALLLTALLTVQAAGSEPMTHWATRAFRGGEQEPPDGRPALVLKRQDHGQLRMGKSVLGTPLRIGQIRFRRGIGTHADSEIVVLLAPGARSFSARVGVDNNDNTQGRNGTVQFSVESAGRELLRTATVRCGAAPLEVNVVLPADARELILKTHQTEDGPSHDHADWADAHILMEDGAVVWLDALRPNTPDEFFPQARPPFSFTYGGQRSESLLPTWTHTAETKEEGDRTRHTATWADPKTGLTVVASVAVFKDFPAVEWLLRFRNAGNVDSPILEDVQALDLTLGTHPEASTVLHQIAGDDCTERSFRPMQRDVGLGQQVRFAPVGGRPSNGTFPFFNVEHAGQGVFVAVGWTGQWAASVSRTADGATRLAAGMERTHLSLHAGEAIRTPRVLLLHWSGDRLDAHNQFRRLLLAHYLPKVKGRPARPAIGSQSFNMNHTGRRPGWNTEAGQVAAARITRDLGCDTHWLDAAWFDGGFPNGVGNWTVRKTAYPNGLGVVGKACDRLGLKFLVWWEPERVAPGTRIARDHPEFVLGGNKGGLFNLGDPTARRWLTDLLLSQIAAFGVDVYRNDFNMDPLPYWRQNDPPDRQGITEVRYVEGFYAMWDEIRAKHPGMVPDNCASGGRRIDLEMCMRSVVQTRSDTACAAGRSDWDQAQTHGLSLYLPIHSTIGWATEPYDVRSTATAGFLGEWDILDEKFPIDQARAGIAEVRGNQPYWYGDFYPLTPWSLAADQWMAYQFHRADLDAGIVLAFRRSASPYPALQARLRGLGAKQIYTATFIGDDRQPKTFTLSGAELAASELRIAKRHGSLLVRYKAAP